MALVALLAAAGSIAPASASTMEEGEQAYQMRRYAEAREIWTELAEAGDADAQLRLAMLLDSSRSLTREGAQTEDLLTEGMLTEGPASAFDWYLKAAQQGRRDAQFQVAGMLASGRGVARDAIAASVWFARAAAHGHALAQEQLAHRYEHGLGAPRNLALAAAWRRLSAIAPLAPEPEGAKAAAGPKPALSAPIPVSDAQVIPYGRDDAAKAVELVWTSAPQPPGARFYVEVKRLAEPASETVHAAYIDRSATIVPLPAEPALYLWRVVSLTPFDGRYAASDWRRFRVGEPGGIATASNGAGAGSEGRDPLADLSRYSVSLLYGRADLPARRFAQALATDFRLSGLSVSEVAIGAETAAVSAVEYFYREDRPIAEAVAQMLPALSGKARFSPASALGAPPFPGAVAITLRGGQSSR